MHFGIMFRRFWPFWPFEMLKKTLLELVEFLGVVVTRSYVPVEIILVENFLNAVVFDERKFFCIESSDVLGGGRLRSLPIVKSNCTKDS